MSILADQNTYVIVQGITGKQGRIHTARMLEENVHVVAGVSPGKGGETVSGLPVYNTVREANQIHTKINASLILTPRQFTLNAVKEACEAEIPLVVAVTEFVPVHDALKMYQLARSHHVTLIGPNTIGIISPGKTKVGIMPGYIYGKGHIGIISRSGTLTHEIASNLTFNGLGQSTCVGIGGDPIIGMNHVDIIKMMAEDEETDAIALIGEIGGQSEEAAAEYIKTHAINKPCIAYIAGSTVPPNTRMGHAGAIISGKTGSYQNKKTALENAGVYVAPTVGMIVTFLKQWNKDHKGRLETLQAINSIV